MHAWLCENPIGVEALQVEGTADAGAEGGEVLIAIKAASLNFPDLLTVQNKYQFKPPLPFVPGSEYAGVVEAWAKASATSRSATRSPPSARAAASAPTPASPRRRDALPKGFAFDDASAFVMTYGTTHHALIDRARAQGGRDLARARRGRRRRHAAIQIGKVLGARVIAAASSDEKCDFCKTLGADATDQLRSGNIRDELKKLTDGKGPDVVYDPVGGDLAEPVFRSIAWRGRYLVVGFAQGSIPALPLNLALLKGASIVGVFWGDFARREPEGQRRRRWPSSRAGTARADQAGDRARSCRCRSLPAAYARMGSRQVRGKLVMTNP
jgi:NADPH2:quinone reductase